jgi:uncharacterized protein YceK
MNGGIALSMAAVMLLSGCATVHKKIDYYRGNTPDLDATNVTDFVNDHNKILDQLKSLSGSAPAGDAADWRPVVDAGIIYVDVRCDRFMDALFWFNRVRETTSRELGFIGSASSAALALVEASKELIGLTPLGFTLLDQTVNNIGNGLLYDLSPSIVRSLVEKQQTAYLQGLSGIKFTSKTSALQAIHAYAAICLPPSIEMEVSRAVEKAEYKPIAFFGETKSEPPVVADDASTAAAELSAPAEVAADRFPTPPANSIPIIGQTPPH